jgi:hypothetical protein
MLALAAAVRLDTGSTISLRALLVRGPHWLRRWIARAKVLQ